MENLKEKLSGEKEKVRWNALLEHHEREALLLVSSNLDLIEVGVAIAQDDVQQVKTWLETEQVKRPDAKLVEEFNEDEQLDFEFIIIQPYVLAQKIEE